MMNKKLLYIPPISHLYNLPKFIKDNKISITTKASVMFENVFLYLFAGLFFGFSKIGLGLFSLIVLFAFLLSPFEWQLITAIKIRIKKSITNWENFASKESYYFLQYQLMGYIIIGYILGIVIVSLRTI